MKKLMIALGMALALTVGCNNTNQEETEKPAEVSETTEVTEEETEKETEITEEESEEETENTEEGETASGRFTQEFDLSGHEAGESVRLWVPHAKTNDFQEISNVEITTEDGDPVEYSVNTDEIGNEMIYAEWTPEETNRKLKYSFDVTRKERLKQDFAPEEEIKEEDFQDYLNSSKLVPVGGPLAELTEEVTGEKQTVEEKSRAIYDYIFQNMERNNDVIGCGPGDVLKTLETKDGKCTDLNSVYVALAKSAGIPARETFGVRISKEKGADMTKGQHCWAEYYQPGTGWVITDVADVLKAVLNDDLEKDSPEAKELYDYYYGNADALRVAFSQGRDLTLNPEQAAGPLNQFGYPYAEVDGEPIDFYAPDEFVYTFTFDAE